jgi:hypothetical protein
VRRRSSAISAAGRAHDWTPPRDPEESEQAGGERDLRADEHRGRGEDADRRPFGRGDVGPPTCRTGEQPRHGEDRRYACKRRQPRAGGAAAAEAGEVVGEVASELGGVAELLLVALGQVVGGLGEDPVALPPADPDGGELAGEPVEVRHASTASTARENVFHSSRRTARASPPARVSR